MAGALEQFYYDSRRPSGKDHQSIAEIDRQIRALNRRCAMPSDFLQLDYQTEPSFFAALQALGHSHDLVLIKPQGFDHLAGLGIRSNRKVYLDGKPTEIGYLHHLRFDEKIRNSSFLARGFKEFRRIFSQKPLALTLTSILEDNHPARKALESNRTSAMMPVYKPISRYLTAMIPLTGPGNRWPVKKRYIAGDYVVRRLEHTDLDLLLRLCLQSGKQRDGVACFSASDFARRESGLLPGLCYKDMIGVFSGDELVGAIGIWNQQQFRQFVVQKTARTIEILRQLWNTGKWLWGQCPLPAPGGAVSYVLLDPWFVRPGLESKVMPLLLASSTHEASKAGASFAALGISENNPAISTINTVYYLAYWSIIYQVFWPENQGHDIAWKNACLSHLGAL